MVCENLLEEKIDYHPDNFWGNEFHNYVRHGSPFKVLEYLRQDGASLACKSKHGTNPVGDIHQDILEQHLDECIVDNIKWDPENPTDITSYTQVTINYKTLLPLTDEKMDEEELDVVEIISKSTNLQHLLTHPTIKTFVNFRWALFEWLLYFDIFHSATLCILLIKWQELNIVGTSWLSIFLVTAVAVEIVEFCFWPLDYIMSFKNYIDNSLIAVTLYLMCAKTDHNIEKLILTFATLVSVMELLLYLGLLPYFAKYANMFIEVAKNFMKFFMYYFMLIFAFAYCFHGMFGPSEYDMALDTDKTFETIGVSLYRTMMMIAGEFNIDGISYNHYPVAGRMLIVMYVLLISVVLTNLLNGLAVSDIQKLLEESEQRSIAAKIDYMINVRKCTLKRGKIFRKLANIMCRYLPKFYRAKILFEEKTIKSVTLKMEHRHLQFMETEVLEINGNTPNLGTIFIKVKNTMPKIKFILQKRRFKEYENST